MQKIYDIFNLLLWTLSIQDWSTRIYCRIRSSELPPSLGPYLWRKAFAPSYSWPPPQMWRDWADSIISTVRSGQLPCRGSMVNYVCITVYSTSRWWLARNSQSGRSQSQRQTNSGPLLWSSAASLKKSMVVHKNVQIVEHRTARQLWNASIHRSRFSTLNFQQSILGLQW